MRTSYGTDKGRSLQKPFSRSGTHLAVQLSSFVEPATIAVEPQSARGMHAAWLKLLPTQHVESPYLRFKHFVMVVALGIPEAGKKPFSKHIKTVHKTNT